MADLAVPSPTPVADAPLPKPVVVLALAALCVFIGAQGWSLVSEWFRLRAELDRASRNAPVGYVNLSPRVSGALPPHPLVKDVGEETLVWSEWTNGEHRWFRLPRGQILASEFKDPMGRDRASAIDEPLLELAGGPRWSRVPDEAEVYGFAHSGSSVAYPLKVLDKVMLVNDLMANLPFLVVFSPFETGAEKVVVFESRQGETRFNFGHTGYFIQGKPILYDRETESFWMKRGESLESFAGERKGVALKLLDRPTSVAWSIWRNANPKGSLVVGAKREPREDVP